MVAQPREFYVIARRKECEFIWLTQFVAGESVSCIWNVDCTNCYE